MHQGKSGRFGANFERLLILTGPLVLLLAWCMPAWSQDLEIRRLAIDSRAIGLGEGTTALDDFAASGNPAALGLNPKPSFAASQARLSYDRYGYELFGVIPWQGALALRFDQVIIQNQSYPQLLFNPDGTPILDPITNMQSWVQRYDTEIESLFGIAQGISFHPKFAVGAEFQVLHLQLGPDFAWGYDGSVGVNAQITDQTRLGILWRQATGQWRAWRVPYHEECSHPMLDAGLTWSFPAIKTLATASCSQELGSHQLPHGKAGLEYSGLAPMTLRAGWAADHLTLGAGFTWKAISADYSAIIGNALYDANRITLRITF